MCSKCGIEKPLSHFGNEKRNRDGKRADCKECYKITRTKWLSRNPNYFKNWHDEHPRYRRERYQLNKERELELNRNWRIQNSELRLYAARKRRQIERCLPYDYSKSDWEYALGYFEYKCAYCGESEKSLQQDHFIPANKGGAFVRNNIVPACKSCNSSKKDHNFQEWYRKQPYCDSNRERLINLYVKNDSQQETA